MKKYYWLLLLFAFSLSGIKAQKIELKCKNKPLNELLVEWRELYQLQFSFNDQLLSQYQITNQNSYPSPDKALDAILMNFPLQYEKNGIVYVIYKIDDAVTSQPIVILGKVAESKGREPLPFSHVLINDTYGITDEKGVFAIEGKSDSLYHVKISHLGYFILDTVFVGTVPENLFLTPSKVGLPEIKVTNNIVETSTQVGEQAGLVSLNHHLADYLPGNADNSVFNLLKLQPGITATGENPDHVMLWGSSEGTSAVQFDGFTIWGLKNLNDNISSINPFMVKSVDVYKGGYGVSKADYVGGIISIIGNNGNRIKPSINLFLNNQTLNGKFELPIGNKSSVIAAYRQNYYDLLSSSDVQLHEISSIENYEWNYNHPDYNFRDVNFKYSFQGDNGDLLYLSTMMGGDKLGFEGTNDSTLSRPNRNYQLTNVLDVEEDSKQVGGTFYYGKTFKSGNASSLQLSYSNYENSYQIETYRQLPNVIVQRYSRYASNNVEELKAESKNRLMLSVNNKMVLGLGFVQNNTGLKESLRKVEYINLVSEASRLFLYAQDEIFFSSKLNAIGGVRLNYATHISQPYIDPRMAVTYKPLPWLKLNAAWGIYHQFISQTSVVDENNMVRYAWFVAGYNDVPILRSDHWVISAAWTDKCFIVSVDTYFKSNDNLTRFISDNSTETISNGNSRSYGVDFYAKKDFRGHSFWASYSFAKTEERYEYFPTTSYRRAPQDQRHELKIAGLFNLNAFHISADYIYGSGFPLFTDNIKYLYDEPDYHRVDLSVVYRISKQLYTAEIGVSLLNVLDRKNIKYNSFQLLPLDEFNTVLVNQEALPFTPLLHLKLKF